MGHGLEECLSRGVELTLDSPFGPPRTDGWNVAEKEIADHIG